MIDQGTLDAGPAEDAGEREDLGPPDLGAPTLCLGGPTAQDPMQEQLTDETYSAQVQVLDEVDCLRGYSLQTDAPLRDHPGGNPRIINELPQSPRVRTSSPMFDALYALSIEETVENSVDAIRDGAFNNGAPVDCAPGGCFETGRLWNYVWTRDTAYAVDLSLAAIDPVRAKNSLEFKLSTRRNGTDLQIVQDTGSGGSYPVSTDRAVWALGAERLLHYLDGAQRQAFIATALEAASNTIEHDRAVVFDAEDGLYRGEQSFLDWREQSYAPWTATDTVHLGMSKALSTNVGHLRLLSLAARLAELEGDASRMMTYAGWADALRQSIRDRLFIPSEGMLSTFIPTFLDPAPVRRYDLLGSSLAILSDVGSAPERAGIVERYPHTSMGPPVMWPQQKDVPIYHNRALWPFVTAYWLRAAKRTQNAAVVEHNVRSMMRGAALNLSNMENLEMVSGLPFVEDGIYSGPVVNSQRQLWSVAGYTSMVHELVFGVETSMDGVRFEPFIPDALADALFATRDSITLAGLLYRGRRINITVHRPNDGVNPTAWVAQEVTLNGAPVAGELTPDMLPNGSTVEIMLTGSNQASDRITIAADTNGETLFSPKPPIISNATLNAGQVQLSLNPGGEPSAAIAFNLFRDGVMIASGISGATDTYVDSAADASAPSHCYVLESYFLSSGNASQHSDPMCYWGPGFDRIQSFTADSFAAVGGTLVNNHGRLHYEAWGDPGHSLTVEGYTAASSGPHLIQVEAGNGAGSFNTGITCGVKLVEVIEVASGNTVGAGQIMMPHLGAWSEWRNSSFVQVDLVMGNSYRIVIREDARSINMSTLDHFSVYTGGTGGTGGPFNHVNISHIKVLSRQGP